MYQTGVVIAHLCLNAIALVCLVTLLMIGPRSNAWLHADDLSRKLTSLIDEEISSPTEFLRALGGGKVAEEPGPLPTYSTGRKHFYVKDWNLIEINWAVTLRQSKLQLEASRISYDVWYTHSTQQFTPWQSVQRLMPNGIVTRMAFSTTGAAFVSFPAGK